MDMMVGGSRVRDRCDCNSSPTRRTPRGGGGSRAIRVERGDARSDDELRSHAARETEGAPVRRGGSIARRDALDDGRVRQEPTAASAIANPLADGPAPPPPRFARRLPRERGSGSRSGSEPAAAVVESGHPDDDARGVPRVHRVHRVHRLYRLYRAYRVDRVHPLTALAAQAPHPNPGSAYSDCSSTARKASWGMLTEPTVFIRFLPSFCFSSSLRLRVMSPP